MSFHDDMYQREQNPSSPQMLSDERFLEQTQYVEEDVEVSEVELYERFTVPRFDEVEETVVWHDFDKVSLQLSPGGTLFVISF